MIFEVAALTVVWLVAYTLVIAGVVTLVQWIGRHRHAR